MTSQRMELSSINRRRFLQWLSLIPVGLSFPAWQPRMAFAQGNSLAGDSLIVIFLRGAADALNIVLPFAEQAYYRARPSLAIARPDDSRVDSRKRGINLDDHFAFHPAMRPLLGAWHDGHLGIVHACGAPDASRSHFQAMELIERGVDSQQGPASGWLGRHLASHQTGNASPLRAIGLGEHLPRSLYGSAPATVLKSIFDFHLASTSDTRQRMHTMLSSLYQDDQHLQRSSTASLELIHMLEQLDPSRYQSEVSYPESDLAHGLRQLALLIKADAGLEVATLDHGGWDTHFVQGGSEGLLASLVSDLSQSLAAFYDDMGEALNKTTVVVMSEFGRRVRENASLGTDHGHGGLMMLLGGHIEGRKVHGTWPGLESEQRVGPGDLAITTDYRDVLAEILQRRLNNQQLDEVFPNYQARQLGVTRD